MPDWEHTHHRPLDRAAEPCCIRVPSGDGAAFMFTSHAPQTANGCSRPGQELNSHPSSEVLLVFSHRALKLHTPRQGFFFTRTSQRHKLLKLARESSFSLTQTTLWYLEIVRNAAAKESVHPMSEKCSHGRGTSLRWSTKRTYEPCGLKDRGAENLGQLALILAKSYGSPC